MKEIEPSFGFEIDFLPVGDKSKSGDAICMRWGNLHDPLKQNVMVVDGGFLSESNHCQYSCKVRLQWMARNCSQWGNVGVNG